MCLKFLSCLKRHLDVDMIYIFGTMALLLLTHCLFKLLNRTNSAFSFGWFFLCYLVRSSYILYFVIIDI